MLNEFLANIKKNGLAGKDDRILLAVSGGIDSMVMTDLFIKSGFNTGIAHCNFCLRGKESDGDEKLVRKLAEKNNLPFYSIRFKTLKYASQKGISVQMAARELRYEWFEKIRSAEGYDYIAVAHNKNDNAETLLLNLARGTGIAGLTGIKSKSAYIIRPLMFARRDTIAEYCESNGIRFREDRSNAGTKYSRNKIRHKVLPVLEKINPSVIDTLDETASRMGETNDIVNYFTDNLRKYLIKKSKDQNVISLRQLAPYLGNSTLVYELFKPFSLTGQMVNDFRNVARGKTGAQVFSVTHRFLKDRDKIIITVTGSPEEVSYTSYSMEELKELPFVKSAGVYRAGKGFEIPREKGVACLDLDKIIFPVISRKWVPGDSFIPFGMKKRKKISDFLIDARLSRIEKEKILVMESAGRIMWIVGERIDDRFRISGDTKRIIKIRTLANR